MDGGTSTPQNPPTQKVFSVAPDHPDALNLLGTALLQLGDPEAAADHLERAARARRKIPACWATWLRRISRSAGMRMRGKLSQGEPPRPGGCAVQLGSRTRSRWNAGWTKPRACAPALRPLPVDALAGSISATCSATGATGRAVPCFLEALEIDPRTRRAQQSGLPAAKALPVRRRRVRVPRVHRSDPGLPHREV